PTDYFTDPPKMRVQMNAVDTNQPGISGLRTVTTDEQGFRVQPPVDYGQDGVLRIFAIGGSTTECDALDDNATCAPRLQESLSAGAAKPAQVVNAGIGGARAPHHLATLPHILDLPPSAAIFLVGAKDWARQIRRHFATAPLWLEEIQVKHTLLGLALQ